LRSALSASIFSLENDQVDGAIISLAAQLFGELGRGRLVGSLGEHEAVADLDDQEDDAEEEGTQDRQDDQQVECGDVQSVQDVIAEDVVLRERCRWVRRLEHRSALS